MAQIRNVDGLVMGQTGNNPFVCGTRMISNGKGTPGGQYRYTIAAGNPVLYINIRYYINISQTNAPSEDFWCTQFISVGLFFDTAGNGQQVFTADWRDAAYIGYGHVISNRQADAYFWSTDPNSFPGSFASTAFLWSNRWDLITITLL